MIFDLFGYQVNTLKIHALKNPVVNINDSENDNGELTGVAIEILFEGQTWYKTFNIPLIEFQEYIVFPKVDNKLKFMYYEWSIIGIDRVPLTERYQVDINKCACAARILPVYINLLNKIYNEATASPNI